MMQIKRGPIARPQKTVLYGPEGVGKSTLAAQWPAPLFLDTEGSTSQLDVARVEIGSWVSLLEGVAAVHKMQEFQTLVIDTTDWAEKLASQHIIQTAGKKSIEDFGFGKGHVMVAEEMQRLLIALDGIVRGGKSVVLLAHSKVVKFSAPDQAAEWDRYELKMSKAVSPLVKEWADAVLFINFLTKTAEKESGKARGIGGKERRIYTTHSAAFDAKNRHGLEQEIPASIEALRPIVQASTAQPTEAPAPVETADVVAEALSEPGAMEFLRSKGMVGADGHPTLDALERIKAMPERFVASVRKAAGK